MAKKILVSSLFVVLVSLLITTTALAAKMKYSFADLNIDGTIVEIEGDGKDKKKNQYSKCSYFSDDYEVWLGQYEAPVVAGSADEEVKGFCVLNFEERGQ